MYKIDITREAGQILKNLSSKQYRKVISIIIALSENPAPGYSRKLSGDNNYHHIDIDEYRIVYRFDKSKVFIAVIGNRNEDELYKRFIQRNL
jgi:mRNA interferase RelE/StbE